MGERKEEKEEKETKGKKEKEKLPMISPPSGGCLAVASWKPPGDYLFYLNIYLFFNLSALCVQSSEDGIRWPGLEFWVVVSCLIGCELWFSGGTASAPTPLGCLCSSDTVCFNTIGGLLCSQCFPIWPG